MPWHLLPRSLRRRRPHGLPEGSAETSPPAAITVAAPAARPPAGFEKALPLFTRTHEQALGYCDELARTLASGLDQAELETLFSLWELSPYHLGALTSARFALQQAKAEPNPPAAESAPTTPHYLVSSWFLARSQAYLTSHPAGEERMHFVSGMQVAKTKSWTLDHLVTVAQSSQSATHAQADQQALLAVLTEMDRWGHTVTGIFHSHPHTGAEWTRPSGVDLDTQERHEAGGYPLISGICTRDGWFRFFAHHPFTITLFGKGVTQYEDHLFQIQSPARHLPHPPR
jgi:proteasome lid subunit RPN8/RPN11